MNIHSSSSDLSRQQAIDAGLLGVSDIAIAPRSSVPAWLSRLSVPPEWSTGHLEGAGMEPCRIAVCGRRTDGGWDGCETLTVYTFSGTPTADHLEEHCRRTLAQLGIDAMEAASLVVPSRPGVSAVRCSGRGNAGGRDVWMQVTLYAAGSTASGEGRLVQQCVYIDASRLAVLGDDVARLSDTLHVAFIKAVNRNGL